MNFTDHNNPTGTLTERAIGYMNVIIQSYKLTGVVNLSSFVDLQADSGKISSTYLGVAGGGLVVWPEKMRAMIGHLVANGLAGRRAIAVFVILDDGLQLRVIAQSPTELVHVHCDVLNRATRELGPIEVERPTYIPGLFGGMFEPPH